MVTPEEEALPVSTTAVLAELRTLRGHSGISHNKVRLRCPCVCRLRATQHQIKASGLSMEDAHVAAYQVIACTIDGSIGDTELAQILRLTLNFVSAPDGLERRRENLIADLNTTYKTYRRLEEDAYGELAAHLVALDYAPCDQSSDRPPPRVSLSLQVDGSPEALFQLLMLLGTEQRQAVADQLGERLLSALPNARSTIATRTDDGETRPWSTVQDLIERTLREMWPPADYTYPELLFEGDVLYRWFAPRAQRAEDIVRNLIPTMVTSLGPYFDGASPTTAFYSAKRANFAALARVMSQIETAQAWATIYRGDIRVSGARPRDH